MPKDYAKQSSKKRTKRFTSSKWLWPIAGLLVGGFIVSLMYLNGHHNPKIAHANIKDKLSVSQLLKRKQRNLEPLPNKQNRPKFEFYTILPNSHPDHEKMVQKQQAQDVQYNYLLQVASVKQAAAADRLKAQLSLMGFDVTVKAIEVSNQTWYRISTGPYTTLASAERAQDDLRKNNINSIVIKRKKYQEPAPTATASESTENNRAPATPERETVENETTRGDSIGAV